MKSTRLILIFFSLIASIGHARSTFLFHSVKDLDKAFIIDRDLKQDTLIISIPDPCNACEELRPFLNAYLADKDSRPDLVIAVGTPLYRKAKDLIDQAPWLNSSLKIFGYHDPGARYRKDINALGIQIVLLSKDGATKKTTALKASTKYDDFTTKGTRP